MQVVILAGGRGVRLKPLTDETPKPMVLINGKPFLQWQVEMLKREGVEDIVICSGYLSGKIVEHFGDGSKFGVRIRHSIEDEPLGTGGALKLAEDLLDKFFIVLYGDSFLPVDFSLVSSWFHGGKEIGMLVTCDAEKVGVPGNVFTGWQGLVRRYDKKSRDPRLQLVDAGMLVFDKKVLELIPEAEVVSLEQDVFPKLIVAKELAAYNTEQRFFDIGTTKGLEKIREVLK